jgi:stage III sporulation protein AA
MPIELQDIVFEIRLRADRPVALSTRDGVVFLLKDGNITNRIISECVFVTKRDVNECFKLICDFSLYSHQDEIRNGFVSLKNGHRVGIAGTAVLENGSIVNVRDISSLSIRIAREMEGISRPIINTLWFNGINTTGALIDGPPASGKTTILRDIAAQFSKGVTEHPLKVCVIDERGELGAVFSGIAANDLGASCDILDNYPKSEGIMVAIRCLSPDLIICDEMGTPDEVYAVITGMNAGVPIITSVHAGSIEELKVRPQGLMLMETGAFSDIVMLKSSKDPGIVAAYYKVSDILS